MKAPRNIFLHVIGFNVEFGDVVDWREDRVNDDDVEYIRKDIVDKLSAACKLVLEDYNDWEMRFATEDELKSVIAEAEGNNE